MLSEVLTRISRTDFGLPSLAGVRRAVLDHGSPRRGAAEAPLQAQAGLPRVDRDRPVAAMYL